MNLDQLQGYVTAHKPVVLGAAAVGVVGLALLRKKTGAAAGGGSGASSSPAGTIRAAAVVPSQQTASTYDSSAYDVYNALSGQLGKLSEAVQQTSGSGITSAPTPVASSLFAPAFTGQYVGYKGDGSPGSNGIYEVQSDGSLYHLDMPEWQQIIASSGGKEPAATTYTGRAPSEYTAASNLQAKINKGAGVS